PPPLGLEPAISPTDSTNNGEWAAKRLRELSDLDSPDFARGIGSPTKLGALMLHLLNKFCSKLDGADLERTSTAAAVL
ncbi:hypothetical protein GGI21_002872, partial [Coemansia aciculifera]